jgi:hypothetical protein
MLFLESEHQIFIAQVMLSFSAGTTHELWADFIQKLGLSNENMSKNTFSWSEAHFKIGLLPEEIKKGAEYIVGDIHGTPIIEKGDKIELHWILRVQPMPNEIIPTWLEERNERIGGIEKFFQILTAYWPAETTITCNTFVMYIIPVELYTPTHWNKKNQPQNYRSIINNKAYNLIPQLMTFNISPILGSVEAVTIAHPNEENVFGISGQGKITLQINKNMIGIAVDTIWSDLVKILNRMEK